MTNKAFSQKCIRNEFMGTTYMLICENWIILIVFHLHILTRLRGKCADDRSICVCWMWGVDGFMCGFCGCAFADLFLHSNTSPCWDPSTYVLNITKWQQGVDHNHFYNALGELGADWRVYSQMSLAQHVSYEVRCVRLPGFLFILPFYFWRFFEDCWIPPGTSAKQDPH